MKQIIRDKIETAIAELQSQRIWPDVTIPAFDVTYSTHRDHGDYASNIALILAKILKKSPLDIGAEIQEQLDRTGLEKVEIVQPGFLNIYINEDFLVGGVQYILEKGDKYGYNTSGIVNGKPLKYVVEFLSANPTGPLHLGNGRGGFSGDIMAKVLRMCGCDVTAEYYVNDFGNQVDTLGESVLRRYIQKQGVNVDYPEDLYKGDYITELATKIDLKDIPLGSQEAMLAIRDEVKEWALLEMINEIKHLCETKFGIHYDVWKSERSLHSKENLERAQAFLKEHDLIYEKDDAVYFASTKYGDDKDRVIIKGDGAHTYFYSDILYLIDKFVDRKIDHYVWYLGADHHGYKGRTEAALKAIGHEGKMDITFVQLVRLIFNGKELRMSKRQGTFVTLEELVDEIGLDVARWFFLMLDANTHMDFDLNLAREKSEKNPVYYVQYAHARIAGVLKKVGEYEAVPLKFTNSAEEQLAKTLFKLPELVEDVSKNYQTHKLPQYALEVARAFHKFYASSRVIDNDEVNVARVQLVQATKIVLANTLKLMGISAPDKM